MRTEFQLQNACGLRYCFRGVAGWVRPKSAVNASRKAFRQRCAILRLFKTVAVDVPLKRLVDHALQRLVIHRKFDAHPRMKRYVVLVL
jgi:hypothetical protein